MSKQFIFIDTCMFREWNIKNIEKNLKQIQNEFRIIIPSEQLHELQKHLLSKYIAYEDKNIEEGIDRFLADNPEHKDKPAIDKKIEKLKTAYNELNQKIEEIKREECSNIIDFLKQQLIISPSIEDYLGAKNRVHSEMAPYTKKEQSNHKHYDSLHWEILLNSKEIPEGSTLYIYTKDKGFFHNNTHSQGLHPLLIQEWAILKKGELKLYMHNEQDKKFCPQEAQEDLPKMQQEAYPSFYVDRILEAGNPIIRHALNDVMDSTRRDRELDRIEDLMHQISRGIIQEFREFEMEHLFEELFYSLKRAQGSTQYPDRLSRMEKKAYHLLQNYQNMR
ncbi:hypothetical protein SAMN02745150_01379 [Brevinema andersonii]|uniref:DUF4935 domain-containing protein n=1 Tax=Brevinema andersonii TaxID=34097 RepID=A0A1I1F2H0_BREAD|nr:PIN domain-containing protein [Brevinema andersonii]SFB93639.1 hypothetical protein SAMN02745150_01379 [Brevinema andersonii]